MIGVVLAKLANEPIITPDDVADLRSMIATKYPGMAPEASTQILSDAIHRIIDKHIEIFSLAYRQLIKSKVLRTALRDNKLRISAADVLKVIIELKVKARSFEEQVIGWVASYQGKVLTVHDIMDFNRSFYALMRPTPQKPVLPDVPSIAELEEMEEASEADTISQNEISFWGRIPWGQAFEKLYDIYHTQITTTAAGIAFVAILSGLLSFGYAMSANAENGKDSLSSSPFNITSSLNRKWQNAGFQPGQLPIVPITSLVQKNLQVHNNPGPPLKYYKKLRVRATAYDLSVESCGKSRFSSGYGVTCSGTRATTGRTIAVDPRLIPLGSRVYLSCPEPFQYLNGIYIAEDTGRLIQGNAIDIFFGEDKPGEWFVHNQADQFGVRMVDVFVLGS